MLNPTGLLIRKNDDWGSGEWGAPRGSRLHMGADYKCIPGQRIVSPIDGKVIRESKPYAHEPYSGFLIRGRTMEIKIFYIDIRRELIGQWIRAGTVLGIAQDISRKYRKKDDYSMIMTPHIHIQIVSIDPALFIDKL